jgi:hypothetical protein
MANIIIKTPAMMFQALLLKNWIGRAMVKIPANSKVIKAPIKANLSISFGRQETNPK